EEKDIAQARVAKRDQQKDRQRQQRKRHRQQKRPAVRQCVADAEATEAREQGEVLVEREDREKASVPSDEHKLEKQRQAGQHRDGGVERGRALSFAPGGELLAR